MRSIDVFVSSCEDVQKERALAERLIRSIAAELDVPVTVCYSNRTTKPASRKSGLPSSGGAADAGPSLYVCFSEDQTSPTDGSAGQHVPNTGQYDAVICIVWSRLGSKLVPSSTMPDGSLPQTATDYEAAWALDQAKGTPGFPALHIYRNRSTPAVPLEPRAEREAFQHRWDSVQAFFSDWGRNPAFAEACGEYRDLGEFEVLFRNRFRMFLASALKAEPFPHERSAKARVREANPFRGLGIFDVSDSPFYHGRTKAVGEVLDVLRVQASAKAPFVLVLGPGGSGTSSLVRAGVVPLLTQLALTEGAGPWRVAITRPGAGTTVGDPFGALAAALFGPSALPEFPAAAKRNGWQVFAAELREHPQKTVLRLKETLDHLGLCWLNQYLDDSEHPEAPSGESTAEVSAVLQGSLWRPKPKVQLVLVVDQLEELFTGGFSSELQRKYMSALAAFVRSQRVCVIATLRTEFYAAFQAACAVEERALLRGRFELYPPTRQEIEAIVNVRAQAARLRYEVDPKTGQTLGAALVEAASAGPDRLPLLEHLLAELYRRQQARNDGVLRWSDYRNLGELAGALANHAERTLLAVNSDAQACLEPTIRQLTLAGVANGTGVMRRPVPYHALISDGAVPAGCAPQTVKGLVDRFIEEGLLQGFAGPNEGLVVSVGQEALLLDWPRIRPFLGADRGAPQPAARPDAPGEPEPNRDRKRALALPRPGAVLEGEALVPGERKPGSPSTARQLPHWYRVSRRLAVLSAAAGLALLAGAMGIGWRAGTLHSARAGAAGARRPDKSDGAKPASSVQGMAAREREAFQTALQEMATKEQMAQEVATLAASQRDTLQGQLKEAEDKAEQAEKNAERATAERDSLEAQLKERDVQTKSAQKNAELAASERDSLQARLRDLESRLQTAQQDAALAAGQRDAMQAQLKDSGARAEQAQRNADLAANQRDAAQAQLREAEAKAEAAVKNAELAVTRGDALAAQLQAAEENARRRPVEVNEEGTGVRPNGEPQPPVSSAAAAERDGRLPQVKPEEQTQPPNPGMSPQPLTSTTPEASPAATPETGLRPVAPEEANGPKPDDATGSAPRQPAPTPSQRNAGPLRPPDKAADREQRLPASLNLMSATEAPLPPGRELAGRLSGSSAFMAPITDRAKADGRQLQALVWDYIRSVESDRTEAQRRFFAGRTNFYGQGSLSREEVQSSTERYHREWPVRRWTPQGRPRIIGSPESGKYQVLQPFHWAVFSGSRSRTGEAILHCVVEKDANGQFHIVSIRQLNR